MKVWILTKKVNDYNQYGEYFVAVFENKPTIKTMKKHGIPEETATHILNNGGGRVGTEYEWYFLRLQPCK